MDVQLKRGLLDVCVLTAIKNEDSYGYKIIKDLKPYIKLSESTLYTILKRLETANMLTVRTAEHGQQNGNTNGGKANVDIEKCHHRNSGNSCKGCPLLGGEGRHLFLLALAFIECGSEFMPFENKEIKHCGKENIDQGHFQIQRPCQTLDPRFACLGYGYDARGGNGRKTACKGA